MTGAKTFLTLEAPANDLPAILGNHVAYLCGVAKIGHYPRDAAGLYCLQDGWTQESVEQVLPLYPGVRVVCWQNGVLAEEDADALYFRCADRLVYVNDGQDRGQQDAALEASVDTGGGIGL